MRDFFFNDTATTEIYTLSLHDALPISFLIFLLTIVGYSSLDAETIMSTLQPLMPHSAFELLSQTVSEVLTMGRIDVLSFGILGTLWASSSEIGRAHV